MQFMKEPNIIEIGKRKREPSPKKWHGGLNHVVDSKCNEWGRNQKALSSHPSLPQKRNRHKTKPKKQKKQTEQNKPKNKCCDSYK